jgi:hypothetical protein
LLHNTARVGVVADPRDPGPARLRLSGAGTERYDRRNSSEREQYAPQPGRSFYTRY